MPSTQTSYRGTVTIAGVFIGEIIRKTGGALDSNETKLATAAMQGERALGGRQIASNVVVEIPFDPAQHNVHWIASQRGRAPMTVNIQKLDDNGAAFGDPFIYTGKLKSCNPVDVDLNGNNPDILTLEQSTDGALS